MLDIKKSKISAVGNKIDLLEKSQNRAHYTEIRKTHISSKFHVTLFSNCVSKPRYERPRYECCCKKLCTYPTAKFDNTVATHPIDKTLSNT